MSLRISKELHNAMTEATHGTPYSLTDIGNKSCRKYDRYMLEGNVVSFPEIKAATPMKNPVNIRFKPELKGDKSDKLLCQIIWWYLDSLENHTKKIPLDIDPNEVRAIHNDIIEGNKNIQKLQAELYANGAFVDYGEADLAMGGWDEILLEL